MQNKKDDHFNCANVWSPTLCKDSRTQDRASVAKDQSSDKNLVNLGPRNARWRFCEAQEPSSCVFRPIV